MGIKMATMKLTGIIIVCPETNEEVIVKHNGYGNGFNFYEQYIFADWQEDKLRVDKCPSCGKEHTCEY